MAATCKQQTELLAGGLLVNGSGIRIDVLCGLLALETIDPTSIKCECDSQACQIDM